VRPQADKATGKADKGKIAGKAAGKAIKTSPAGVKKKKGADSWNDVPVVKKKDSFDVDAMFSDMGLTAKPTFEVRRVLF
jgi:hypothetical protein